jgi:hypothetical protein
MANGVEFKAERRKPSGEKHCDIEDNPSLTGVLAHFRLHSFNAIWLHAGGARLAATGVASMIETALQPRSRVLSQ